MSLTASSRFHYFIDYPDGIVPVEKILRLGSSYEVAQLVEDTPLHPTQDQLRYKHGQRASWQSLPLEVRLVIYDHVYANAYRHVSPDEYPGMSLLIGSWKYQRDVYTNPPSSSLAGYPDDDIMVVFPREFADLLVSKQWLLETVPIMAKLGRWHYIVCESRSWRLAVQAYDQFRTDSTLSSLSRYLYSVIFSMATSIYFVIKDGESFVDYFEMEHLQISRRLAYVRVHYYDLVDKLFWVRSRSGDDTNNNVDGGDGGDGEEGRLDIMLASSITASTIRKRALTLPRTTVDSIMRDFPSGIRHGINRLPENIRAGITKWAAGDQAYQSFKAMFEQWRGPKPGSASEFIVRVSCMIEGNSEEALGFDFSIRPTGRVYVQIFISRDSLDILKDFEQSATPDTVETEVSATTHIDEQTT